MTSIEIINVDHIFAYYKLEVYYKTECDDRKRDRSMTTEWKQLFDENIAAECNQLADENIKINNVYDMDFIYVYLRYGDSTYKFTFTIYGNPKNIKLTFHEGVNDPFVRLNGEKNQTNKSTNKWKTWMFTILCFPLGGCCVCGSDKNCLDF